MNIEAARAILDRPLPVALAAKAFGCPQELLTPALKDGQIALGEAFRLARRQAEEQLRSVRHAHRSALMVARRAAQRAARAVVARDRMVYVLAALRASVAASCAALADRLLPIAPRLSDLARRAGEAVLEVDPATDLRPAKRSPR